MPEGHREDTLTETSTPIARPGLITDRQIESDHKLPLNYWCSGSS